MVTPKVAVYARGDRFFVTSMSRTVTRLGLETGPVEILPTSIGSDDLGEVVLQRAAAAVSDLPHPSKEDFKRIAAEGLPTVAGFKSYNAFAKGSRLVVVLVDEGGAFTARPSKNGGPNEGFIPLPESAVTADSASPSDVGGAVLAALDAAE